jgi:hypothetical protein
MEKSKTPVAIDAAEAPMRAKTSNYPEHGRARAAAPWRSFRSHPPRREPLEVGARTQGGMGACPEDDIEASLGTGGKWRFVHKNGSPH